MQVAFSPVLVADRDFWENNKESDAAGDWPTPTRTQAFVGGQPDTRTLVVFNDDLRGEQVNVSWSLRLGAATGPVVQQGSFTTHVPLGSRVLKQISLTPPAQGGQAYLVLSASKPREGIVFQDSSETFPVLP